MNKRAETGEIIKDTAVYLILLVLFFAGMVFFVFSQRDGAAVWSDIYAKEIVKIINLGENGDEIELDVQQITGIAIKNEVNVDKIFSFDNERKEVCVRLSTGRRSCYSYFNDVDVKDVKLELGVPVNILSFRIEKSGGKNE